MPIILSFEPPKNKLHCVSIVQHYNKAVNVRSHIFTEVQTILGSGENIMQTQKQLDKQSKTMDWYQEINRHDYKRTAQECMCQALREFLRELFPKGRTLTTAKRLCIPAYLTHNWRAQI